jgi:hypothetical protein
MDKSSRAARIVNEETEPAGIRGAARTYAAFLNCSNRSASRSGSGRSSSRLGLPINVPAIPFQPKFEKRAIVDFE